MYRTMEVMNNQALPMEVKLPENREEKQARRFDALLDLTETIATLTIGGGFLLLVAACLAAI